MRDRKRKGLRISDPFVAISSCMGGIPPARFANHAPFSIIFSHATISGKRCRHLSIIALPLSAGVGSITTIATASTSKATYAAPSTSTSTTASILGEFGLGLIDPMLVDRLGAFRDAMIGITAIEKASRCFCGIFHSFDTFKELNRLLASLHSLLMSIRREESFRLVKYEAVAIAQLPADVQKSA